MDIQTVFEALTDPNRRLIITLLKEREMSVNEVLEHFDLSGASLSHHLRKLKSANLIVSKRRAQRIVYSLDLDFLRKTKLAIDELLFVKPNTVYE